ncbi:hypothetical protein F4680DRAFT_439373 [Xylaria scruposa]|nr:hypothetical protein F4680DRAFT_439373 [Xylaria scruposa]
MSKCDYGGVGVVTDTHGRSGRMGRDNDDVPYGHSAARCHRRQARRHVIWNPDSDLRRRLHSEYMVGSLLLFSSTAFSVVLLCMYGIKRNGIRDLDTYYRSLSLSFVILFLSSDCETMCRSRCYTAPQIVIPEHLLHYNTCMYNSDIVPIFSQRAL